MKIHIHSTVLFLHRSLMSILENVTESDRKINPDYPYHSLLVTMSKSKQQCSAHKKFTKICLQKDMASHMTIAHSKMSLPHGAWDKLWWSETHSHMGCYIFL